MGEPDIDLYADDLDAEFNDDSEYNHESNVDLYDDVITPSDERNEEGRSTGGSPRRIPTGISKRIPVCVGNLTWWTTDKDLIETIKDVGVNDVVDIKFHENRANGQSKGYCIVYVTSENSVRIILEKLPQKEIHGQNPVVTPCSKQNLSFFEIQSRKGGGRPEGPPDRRMFRDREWENRDFTVERIRGINQERPRSRGNPLPPYQHMQRGPTGLQIQHPSPQPPPVPYQPGHPWIPPPQMHHIPPPTSRPGALPAANTSVPPPPPGLQGPPPVRPGLPPPANVRVPPPRGPPPPLGPRGVPIPDTRAPPPVHPEWERQPPPQHVGLPPQPQVGLPNRALPPASSASQGLPTSVPPPAHHAPSPHINPAFLQHHQPTAVSTQSSQQSEAYSRPQYAEYRPTSDRPSESALSVTDPEFEEIMSRNRSVSSSAISRAVADASAGDYAAAIETLVTAISLIKQSKVANDERCKILISSLQDTLHGIESKSYGSRSKERARSRERERSRERSSRREKSSRRDRSRSRDRDYRDRSRERDRYHDDRYRDKDRDHDRDRRSRH